MKNIISSLILFISHLLSAQTNHVIVEGKVTDILHNPIPYTAIQNIATREGSITDATGHYSFNATLPATLKISLIGYKTILKKLQPEPGKDTIHADFVLEIDSIPLKEIAIAATHEPELLKESGTLLDFETGQHKLWLLYHYRKGDHLEVYDTGIHYITRTILKKHSENINITPHHFVYIETSDSVRFFDYETVNNLIYESSIGPSKFHIFMNHLIAFNYPDYYYLWNSFDSSAMYYWYFNSSTKKQKILYTYTNSVLSAENSSILTDLYIYHILLFPIELNTRDITEIIPTVMSATEESGNSEYASPTLWQGASGRDPREKGSGERPKNSREIEDTSMTAKMMFHSIYCPFRIVRDSIYIFNFYNDTIYVYDLNNSKQRKMPLSFYMHGVKYHYTDIMVNEERSECYFKFVLNGATYLQQIDLDTGNKLNTQKLGSPLPEKIRIMVGYAYYTYSDAQSNQMFVRHLYRQKIN